MLYYIGVSGNRVLYGLRKATSIAGGLALNYVLGLSVVVSLGL